MATAKDTTRPSSAPHHDRLIRRALRLIEARARQPGILLNDPDTVGDWFRLRMAGYEREVFAVAWLDNGHRLIGFYELFFGTHNQADIHVREVVKSALACNAAAGLFAHNHPSGRTDPSASDIAITAHLADALHLVGVNVLDHFIITAGSAPYSMAQHGDWPGNDNPVDGWRIFAGKAKTAERRTGV